MPFSGAQLKTQLNTGLLSPFCTMLERILICLNLMCIQKNNASQTKLFAVMLININSCLGP
uniref:Uncharacterized protein n=1 Tax=Anguilla anguilla TaxID=7936 RepID=A0A0E9PUW7_ANGAN